MFWTILSFASLLLMPQDPTPPAQVVQAQLEAYNARDIDRFMALFSADCRVMEYPGNRVLAEGWEATKGLYQGLFDASPNLHSELLHRSVLGNKVIDHERITGRAGIDEAIELAVIFEVQAGKITSCMVIR